METKEIFDEEVAVKQELDLKKEKKWCSGIGLNYFLFVILTMVGQVVMMVIMSTLLPQAMENPSLYYVLGMMPIYVLAFPITAIILKKTREKETIEKHKMKVGHFIISISMCYTLMVAGNIIGVMVNGVIGFIKGSPIANDVVNMLEGMDIWASVLLVVICAPIVEELLYRKFLIDRMAKYGEGIAIVTSGLMFGLFHGNFSQFFYATFLGMFLAFIYVKTGKVWYTILLHMIINFSSGILATLLLGNLDQDLLNNMQDTAKLAELMNSAEIQSMIVPLLLFLVYMIFMYGMAILGGVFFIVKRKSFTCKPGKVTLPKGKRAAVVWGNVGMILFVLVNAALFIAALM